MSGISVGHSHPRPRLGEKTLRRCRNNEEADNVILIDVDSEYFDNVIIIDIPESLPKEKQNSNVLRKDKKSSFRNVIYIDDDENPESNHSFGVNGAGFSAGTSSSRDSHRVAKNVSESAYADFEDCHYVQDTSTPVRLSKKGKRINSGKASTRNHYGLHAESDNDSSDNDYPDCEVVEDSSGKVQELWEKASSRRKKDFQNGHSDIRDHDSTSRVFDGVNRRNFEMEYANRQRMEAASGFPETAAGNGQEREHLEPHSSGGGEEMENLIPKRCSFKRSTLPHKQTDHSSTPLSEAVGPVSGKSSFSKGNLGSGDNIEKDDQQGNSHVDPDVSLFKNTPRNEAKLREDISMSNIQEKEDKDGQLRSPNADTSPSMGDCIYNEREKLKETDEYKRAMEEEWASRKQALQIQAEEAQHLRRLQKRKKAESMRLLDMERRQKQRVEEMRNTQKKDEENMNLKEIVRAEVRKELKKLELSCHNMASLLHLLGIPVGGWPTPLPQEVQAAYKRALLTFHPDRTSQSDIRQQVEAEEKFKLINRLKEKFSPSL